MGHADRTKDTSTTTGAGNFTLSGTPPTGYVAFGTMFAVNAPISYCIVNSNGEWEVGVGYLSASTTLVRDRVLRSSNADAIVTFSAGTKDVFVTFAADDIIDQGVAQALAASLILP